jgi:hypothetical protein
VNFIDGRALSETVFRDYLRILYNRDNAGGKSREQLLDEYGAMWSWRAVAMYPR